MKIRLKQGQMIKYSAPLLIGRSRSRSGMPLSDWLRATTIQQLDLLPSLLRNPHSIHFHGSFITS